MSKTTNKFAPEVRERAVRMVLEGGKDHTSRWSAMVAIAEKIGCSAHTLNEWVKKAEVESGQRAGVPSQQQRKSLLDGIAAVDRRRGAVADQTGVGKHGSP